MSDYRTSHFERGDSYDENISITPFDAYMADWEKQYVFQIVGELFPGGVDRYLDFACGTGRISATIAPVSKQAVGVDVSPSMIQVARDKLPTVAFQLCDLTTVDLDIGVFNLVTAFRFFGNAQDELRESALKAIVKRMAPGAYLIINSHRNPLALSALLHRATSGEDQGLDLSLRKLRRLLLRHGLKIEKLQPIGAWMYRSRLLGSLSADDPRAIRNEKLFGAPLLATIAPDVIVVAKRV